MRVLELYSGVGGYHLALQRVLPDRALDVHPIDNNSNANKTYELNLDCRPQQHNIEYMTQDDVDNFDLWTLSPPCQPHTTTSHSLQQDVADERSNSFTHLVSLLATHPRPPPYIMLENVPGFLGSASFRLLREQLEARQYAWQAFLLTPLMFGVPNSRPRVFVLASLRTNPPMALPKLERRVALLPPAVLLDNPALVEHASLPFTIAGAEQQSIGKLATERAATFAEHWEPCRRLGEYLSFDMDASDPAKCSADQGSCPQCDTLGDVASLMLDGHVVSKYHRVLDVVTSQSRHTNCFTKGYRKNVLASGSFMSSQRFADESCSLNAEGRYHITDDGAAELKTSASVPSSACTKVSSGIRYLAAGEISALHGYDTSFKFPQDLDERQKCALLGNGLCLNCITALLRHLLRNT